MVVYWLSFTKPSGGFFVGGNGRAGTGGPGGSAGRSLTVHVGGAKDATWSPVGFGGLSWRRGR
eukprot:4843665-Prorocentrum_lima.AAC.1